MAPHFVSPSLRADVTLIFANGPWPPLDHCLSSFSAMGDVDVLSASSSKTLFRIALASRDLTVGIQQVPLDRFLGDALSLSAFCHHHGRPKPGSQKFESMALNIRMLSSSRAPFMLRSEAFAFESLIGRITEDFDGYRIDHLGMCIAPLHDKRFEAQDPGSLTRLFQVHSVADGMERFIHTHGMAKFACPDLEWYLPPDGQPSKAGALINQIAEYMVEQGAALEPGQTLRSEDGRVQIKIVPALSRPDHDYGGNRVVRLEAVAGSRLFMRGATNLDRPKLVREEYFHGSPA